jgi:hypothetical protein
MTSKRMTFAQHYVHGLRGAIRHNAPALAFSLMSTSSFGVVWSSEGTPSIGEVYAFVAGAVLGFAAVLAVATAAFRSISIIEAEPGRVLVVGSALALGSTAVGIGAATLVGALVDGLLAWSLAPFGACVVFLLVVGLEFAIVELVEGVGGLSAQSEARTLPAMRRSNQGQPAGSREGRAARERRGADGGGAAEHRRP